MPSIIDANCCPQGCPWENGGYCGEKLVDMQKGGYCQNQVLGITVEESICCKAFSHDICLSIQLH